jgi:SAM-dependent methyltransferase
LESITTSHGFEQVDVVGNALKLPFADNHFDCTVAFQVLEHIPDPLEMLSEAYRIIKPGGYLVLTTPFMWGEHEQPHDYYRYTQFGLGYLAEKAGFEKIRIEGQTGYWGTSVLRFNYWLLRFSKGFLGYLIKPLFFINQHFARFMDSLDKSIKYMVDTATYIAVFQKPSPGTRRNQSMEI